ncbi:MAG: hypothetical protein L6Q98_03280 [Anaerolineae bacterium]|nr:hypothetical protein [Anaerolineae bacterium]NUQ02382.1 hypothetical protein [Anaerolineae bacterium]
MNKMRMLLVAAAVAVGLTGTVVVNAQDNARPGPLQGRARPGMQIVREVADILSAQTGLSAVELLQQIRQTDQTLAEIITANGGSVETVSAEVIAAITADITQAVADGRLTQERADEILANLPQAVADALSRDPQRGGRVERELGHMLRDRALMKAVEDATGLHPRDVLEQMRLGKTLGEVITENGGDPQEVIDATLAAATERLAQAVENGRITQERADDRLAQLETLLNDVMSGTLRERLAASGSA